MLVDENIFEETMSELKESKALDNFIEKNGSVVKKAMLTLGNPPSDSNIEIEEGSLAFIFSTDTFDCEIGIVFDTVEKKPLSGFWVIRQTKSANPPDNKSFGQFAELIMEAIDDDGGVHTPLCCVIAENDERLVAKPSQRWWAVQDLNL